MGKSVPFSNDDNIREWAMEVYTNEVLEHDFEEHEIKSIDIERVIPLSNVLREPFKSAASDLHTGPTMHGDIFNKPISIDPSQLGGLPSIPNVPYFLSMALTADFIILDAMIRLGADVHKVCTLPNGHTDSALSMACRMLAQMPAELRIQGKHEYFSSIEEEARYRMVLRLLQVGVDPDKCYPLHVACEGNNLRLAALLLQYGANPDVKRQGKTAVQLLRPELRKKFRKLPRGGRSKAKCWCLNGKNAEDCHERKHGQLYNDDKRCPCGKRKSYAKCCKKRGVKFYETRDSVCERRPIQANPSTPGLMNALKALSENRKPNEPLFPPEVASQYGPMMERFSSMLETVGLDPAFSYALKKCDFIPQYWRDVLPKGEQQLRQIEWNNAVDEYIASGVDSRDEIEIERCAKIGVDGARMLKVCPQCMEYEDEQNEFKLCSKCKVHAYCSTECQKQHWQSSHKRLCGKERNTEQIGCPLHLKSEEIIYMAQQMLVSTMPSVDQIRNMMKQL